MTATTDPKVIAAAILAAMDAINAGGPLEEISVQIGANASLPVNTSGSRVYVVDSTYNDNTQGFAPFTVKTDTGLSISVIEPRASFKIGQFKRLQFVNPNATAITVTMYAGTGDYRRDGTPTAERVFQVANAQIARAAAPIVYAAGQVVGPSPIGAGFAPLVAGNGGNGYVRKVRVTKSTNVTAAAAFRLFLFSLAPAGQADGAAFAIPAEAYNEHVPKLAGIVDLPQFTAEGGGGGAVCEVVVNVPFVCDPAQSGLFGVLVAEDAYNSAASETFTVTVWADQG